VQEAGNPSIKMAAMGPMVVKTPHGLEIKGRRRLEKPGAFERLMDELQRNLQQKDGQPTSIADLDVSQNKLSYEQFETLFTQLGAHNVKVLRFRMFGCPTLTDDVARIIGDYLRLLTQENAPSEMHLSDCAITADGFITFISAFEETDIYPLPHPSGTKHTALYLRLENNYISETVIQEKVDAGVIKPLQKSKGARPGADSTTKIDLVVRDLGKYQQKEGEPPAPENAPPPKEVWDKWSETNSWQSNNNWQGGWQGKGGQGGQGWQGKGGQNWQGGGQNWQGGWQGGWQGKGGGQSWQARVVQPAAAALPGPGGARTITPRAVVAPRAATLISPKIVAPGSALKPAGGAWARGGAAGGAQDRSRTPAARVNGGAAKPPMGPPPGKKAGDLPAPWEEHWSDEYQIPYFWNAETGDSAWEKPTA